MTGKVVATFDNPVAAELAHNYLADHGLHPLLANEEVSSAFAGMSNLVGSVKLLVPDDEEAVAKDLLANRPQVEGDIPADAIAAAGVHVREEPGDSLEESAADKHARRAFRTMVFGLIPPLWPIQFYGIYLLMGIGQEGRLSPRYRWTPLWCILLFLPLWLMIGIGLAMILKAVDEPTAPHWRAEAIPFSNDHDIGVEFPNPVESLSLRNRSPAGDSRETRLHAVQGNCDYWGYVDIPINPPEIPLTDDTLELVLKDAERAGREILSHKFIQHNSHTGIEYRTKFADKNGRTWFGRWQVFRVEDRFLAVGLEGIGDAVTDDARAKRFFRSLRIP